MPGRYRRPAPADREQAAPTRAAKLTALHQTLTDQVTALASGEQWQRWLTVAARFHTYSVNNTLLLLAQKPDATQVAGYTLWQQLGRQVRRGEKGLAILAPVTARTDPSGGPDAGDVDPPAARRIVGYRPVYVWDVSQTDGPPLPTPPTPSPLVGHAPDGLWDALTAQCAAAGFTVTREPIAGTAGPHGYTDFVTHRVVVRADVDDAQAVKTLAHELAHVLLHDPKQFRDGQTRGCRGTGEVEAESVAYLVAADRGLNTSTYSFAYVTGWAAQTANPEETLRGTASRVLTTAHAVLDRLAPRIASSALEQVATRVQDGAGRTSRLRQEQASTSAARSRSRLLAANAAAAAYFTEQYAASWAPGYLEQRLGVALDAETHGLGHAPGGWTTLTEHLRFGGFTDEEILAAGLATRASTGRLIDRFRDRLTFAIHATGSDETAEVVGFIARRNPSRDGVADGREPKYLNTAQTALYTKGDHLHGLIEGRDVLARGGMCVLVEGPMDVVAVTAAANGTMAAVAPLGIALTEHQAQELAAALGPHRDRLVLATDPDSAGQQAAQRAYQLLTQHDLDPRLARLSAGLDPADTALLYGPAALIDHLASAEPAARQLVAAALSGRELQWPEQRAAATTYAARVIAAAPPGTWQREIRATATATGLNADALTAAVVDRVQSGAADRRVHAGVSRCDLRTSQPPSTDCSRGRPEPYAAAQRSHRSTAADRSVTRGGTR